MSLLKRLLPSRRTLLTLGNFGNAFQWALYYPNYFPDEVDARDYAIQLVFSLIAAVVAVTLITQALLLAASTAAIALEVVVFPTPQQVSDLFAQQLASGAVQGLSCPCSTPSSPLAATTAVAWAEDAFCAQVRGLVDPNRPDQAALLAELLTDAGNEQCLAPAGRAALAGALGALALQAGLFAAGDPALAAKQAALADRAERGLCAAAFGVALNQGNFFPQSPPVATRYANGCASPGNTERPFLLPPAYQFSVEESAATILKHQATRMATLLSASISTCTTLFRARSAFAAEAAALALVTPAALSPADLPGAAQRLYRDLLATRVQALAALTPGFSPEDTLAAATDAFNPGLRFAPVLPATRFEVIDFPFSSRLPFARTDFVQGGTREYFVTAGSPTGLTPVLGGELRLRVDAAAVGGFPYLQTTGAVATPGFSAAAAAAAAGGTGWVPVGDDALTLLDACLSASRGGPQLSLDVHNVRPLVLLPGVNASALAPPFAEVAAAVGGGAAGGVGAFCSAPGAGQPPPAAPGAPQPVLLNLPLTCPRLLVFLGALRANSTYYAPSANASLRFSVADFLQAFPGGTVPPSPAQYTPAQAALRARVALGDFGERAALYESMMFERGGPRFSHSAAAHYAACAPAACTYTSIAKRTTNELALEAVSIYGGTTTTVISGLFFLAYFLSFFGQQWDARRAAAAAAAAAAAGGGAGAAAGGRG
jgi:hypothetical protein